MFNPFGFSVMTYVKVVAFISAMAAAGWAGHFVTKTHYVQKLVGIEREANKVYKDSVLKFKRSVSEKENIIREVRKTNIALLNKIRIDATKREEAINAAVRDSVVSGYSVGYGRVWNDPICRANGMPGCLGDPRGLVSDSRNSTITSEALLRNHGRITDMLGACHRNIQKIKDAQDKYRETLKEK